MDTGTARTEKEITIMELAGRVMEMAATLDEQLSEFFEGGRPSDTAEKSPQPVLSPLNTIAVRLEITAKRIENATSLFHSIANKVS